MINKTVSISPDLTNEKLLKTLIENRTIYNLENCELNLFETYQKSELVPLQFNDLVVTSMLRGKKVMHLFDKEGFDYLPGESVIIPANVEMKIDFPEATFDNPTQCLALAIDHKKIKDTLNFLNEKYPKEGQNNFWQLDETNFYFENNEDMSIVINKIINIDGKMITLDNNKITTSIEVTDTVIFNSQGSHATINTPENKNSLDSDN